MILQHRYCNLLFKTQNIFSVQIKAGFIHNFQIFSICLQCQRIAKIFYIFTFQKEIKNVYILYYSTTQFWSSDHYYFSCLIFIDRFNHHSGSSSSTSIHPNTGRSTSVMNRHWTMHYAVLHQVNSLPPKNGSRVPLFVRFNIQSNTTSASTPMSRR